jgi:hypothetical protein
VACDPIRVTEPLPRSRGTVVMQVLVAALFLAVIGGSVGLALGLRDRDGTGGARQGNGATGAGETAAPSDGLPSTLCPPRVSRQAGRGELAQVLYIQTKYSEVWICRDDGGALYYQGHRLTRDDWLFLSDVRQDGDEYLATSRDGTTVYQVSRQQLVIKNDGGGEAETQPVTAVG